MQSNLYNLNQWVVWRLETRPGQIKPTKIPINPITLRAASSTDPTTWSDYQTASAMLNIDPSLNGVGFILTPNDPYFLLDLDGCRDSDTGVMSPEATAICSVFPGSAWEISTSGEGIHIIGQCDGESLKQHRNKWNGWCEFYTRDRFIAFGAGRGSLYGNPDIDHTDTLRAIVPLRPDGSDVSLDTLAGNGPRADWRGPSDDDELIKRILASSGGPMAKMGRAPKPESLWHGDGQVLGAFYPDQTGQRLYDASSADQALMNVLAYWTGCDYDRMIRLFSRSSLGQRDKWQKRAYYRNHTVMSSVRTTNKVYTGNTKEKFEASITAEHKAIPVMSLEDCMREFVFILESSGSHGAGYVGHRSTRNVYPIGLVKSWLAGSTIDIAGNDPTKPPKQIPVMDVWLKQKTQYEETLAWVPNGQSSVKSAEGNRGAFNTWRGFHKHDHTDTMISDITLREHWLKAWHQQLAFLIPINEERQRFEQWLAHIVQRPDQLPQTGWIFITPTKGTGRNWLASVLDNVLLGYVANNLELSDVLTGQFNGQLSQKLLAVVDEAKAGMEGPMRWILKEKAKNIINPKTRKINIKGGMQYVERNYLRWLIFSNNWDAVALDADDRRYNIVANPVEKPGADYYQWLYSFEDQPEFLAAVWAHLATLPLTGFNHGGEAVMNEAKQRLIGALSSDLEVAIDEFAKSWGGRVAFARHLRDFVTRECGNGKPISDSTIRRVAGLKKIRFMDFRIKDRNAKDERFIVLDENLSDGEISNIARRQEFVAEVLNNESKFLFN